VTPNTRLARLRPCRYCRDGPTGDPHGHHDASVSQEGSENLLAGRAERHSHTPARLNQGMCDTLAESQNVTMMTSYGHSHASISSMKTALSFPQKGVGLFLLPESLTPFGSPRNRDAMPSPSTTMRPPVSRRL
jgi:hypothetical protein